MTVKDSQTDSDIASDRQCEAEKERLTVRQSNNMQMNNLKQVLKEILKQFYLSNWTSGVYVTN